MKTSPTQRSVKYLREQGFIVAKVEQKLHMPDSPFPMTRDCFGFGDLLIARKDFGAALVQVTSSSNLAKRIWKIKGIPEDESDLKQVNDAAKAHINAIIWLESGNRIFVHGWAKRGPRGKQKKWKLTERELMLEEIQDAQISHRD